MKSKNKTRITAVFLATIFAVVTTGTTLVKNTPYTYEENTISFKLSESSFEKKLK